MPLIVPLPQSVRNVLGPCANLVGVHPGLVLDKFAESWDTSGATQGLSERVQKPVIDQVMRLSASPPPDQIDPADPNAPPGRWFDDLVKRWEALTAGGAAFTGTTAGPLTLHLARASALENAGICLHPIYGFTYLPGSGLKGLARAFAETVWLPALSTEAERLAGWERIEAVFGWAPGSNEQTDGAGKRVPKSWMPVGAEQYRAEKKDESGEIIRKARSTSAGAVVFHDAWPRKWPRLITDILNSHHKEYYSQSNTPPGDWENPEPVYFLSVPPGVPFRFAVAKRRDDVPQEFLDLAADWLAGGLTVLGCGAKTATGYGHFTVDRGAKPVVSAARPSFATTLELVTPAFLAGAEQTDPTSCDLRPATLRGQLRWWWRTLHAGFVDVPTLKRMEAAVWGDTKSGAAVRLTVSANGRIQPLPFDRDGPNGIIKANRIPNTPEMQQRKETPGLKYHSFGMDERRGNDHVRRFYLPPGSKWDVGLTARASQLPPASKDGKPIPLSADVLLEQARSALALLCHFGGVGAKARKGFGSFADLPGFDLAALKRSATDFRARCGRGTPAFQPALAGSPALEQLLGPLEVPTGGANGWLALDQLAAAAQQFAKRYKHRLEKKALGLPRKIGAPVSGTFRAGRHVKDRHASPVLYHFDRVNGLLVARVTAFPAAELPNVADSAKLLKELLAELGPGLGGRFDDHVKGKPAPGAPPGVPATATAGPQLKVGQRVKAKIVPDAKGKGRVFAEAGGRTGIVEGVPPGQTLTPNVDEVELVVKVLGSDGKQVTFKWPV